MTERAPSLRDIEAQIIARALKDPQFRNQLMANPREALASIGIQLPADIQVKIIEQEPKTLYLVLPTRPALFDAADELSEAELGQVVGASGNCPGR